MKTKIIVDGTCGFTNEELKKFDLGYIKLWTIIDNEKFSSNDENLDSLLLNAFKNKKNLSTSQPSRGEIIKEVEKYKDFDLVLIVTVSAKFSKTFENIEQTTKDYKNVVVFDSYSGDITLYQMVMGVIDLLKNNPSKEEIITFLKDKRKRSDKTQFLIVDDLQPLIKSGRINSKLAFFANLMQIKPIITFEKGELKKFAKVRSFKRAIQKPLKFLAKDLDQIKKIVFSHFFASDEIVEFTKTQIKEILNNIPYEIRKFSPLVATHTGIGTVAITAILK